jgi:hypothetical protein
MTSDQKLIQALLELNLIHHGFVGQVTLHIMEGPVLGDADRHETSIIRRMKRQAGKNSLDIGLKMVAP